ncbi:hypothetical protein [Bacillus sp. 1P06AnD]|uniref:hypothetical protein n=1 Tax=Bacillus sp. 1P06AnD TaxID=3132208 RepID=UPI0039A1E0EF
MKKLLMALSLVGLVALAGCGSNEASDTPKKNQDQTETKDQTNKEDSKSTETSDESSNKENSTANDSSSSQQGSNTAADDENKQQSTENGTSENQTNSSSSSNNAAQSADTKDLTYQSGGQSKTEAAKLMKSSNQNYSMYVLPNFELTGEEPGKDVLYLKDNDNVSMRIQLLDKPDWAQMEQNVPTELEDTNKTITHPQESDLQLPNATVYEASNGTDVVTIYLVKDSQKPMKLTLFTKADNDVRSAFISMAKTISR